MNDIPLMGISNADVLCRLCSFWGFLHVSKSMSTNFYQCVIFEKTILRIIKTKLLSIVVDIVKKITYLYID